MSNQLSVVERNELQECEDGILDCVENMGMFLLRIRDKRLYREQYDTFEAYTKDKFGLPKSRAYEHIEAAQSRIRLSEISDVCPKAADVKKESHLRTLKNVPADSLPAVIEKAFETTEKPTAKDFEAAKSVVLDTPKTELLDATSEESKPVDYVLERAKTKLDEHLKGVRLQCSHLGIGPTVERYIDGIRKQAGI